MFRSPPTTSSALRKSTPVPERQRLTVVAVGALGVSCVMAQLALMRELLGAFSGNEMVLGVVLGLWLLLMGIGAWLGRSSERLRNQLAVLAVIQMLVAILPLLQGLAADAGGVHYSLFVPFFAYLYLIFYGIKGYRKVIK